MSRVNLDHVCKGMLSRWTVRVLVLVRTDGWRMSSLSHERAASVEKVEEAASQSVLLIHSDPYRGVGGQEVTEFNIKRAEEVR